MKNLTVKILQKAAISANEIQQITDLINTVYKSSEGEFWPSDGSYSRTNIDEIADFITKGEMIVSMYDNKIVGSVHVYPIDKTTLGFGMLTSSLDYRKMGVGNLLLKAVESFAINNQYSIIQLELLKPETFNHPEKEFLEKWYQKWGYKHQETIPHEKLYFKQATMLKFPCKFDIFQKLLL
ncbi:MAG: GNAT family N-acetyltransferase [Flavobacteriaceae bacterium]|nr:GNAT family N-acetyltransferase [Flavobacteriaceae bacterium]